MLILKMIVSIFCIIFLIKLKWPKNKSISAVVLCSRFSGYIPYFSTYKPWTYSIFSPTVKKAVLQSESESELQSEGDFCKTTNHRPSDHQPTVQLTHWPPATDPLTTDHQPTTHRPSTTDLLATDHRRTDPLTTNHQPTNPPTHQPPTHRPLTHLPPTTDHRPMVIKPPTTERCVFPKGFCIPCNLSLHHLLFS